MSVLETPRILFKGEITWDPIVTNNYDTFYNEDTDSPVWPPAPDRVAAFRQEAIKSVITGTWNPDGTHRSTFYNTAISGVDLGSGVVGDPFVAAASNFTGMLVDLEPYGTLTSQLYFDAMRFGIDGGYRIFCKRSSRATARYVNFSRNPANAMIAGIASVIWQTSFAKADGLLVDAFDSPALQCLAEKLKSDEVLGLTVQFNTYRTVYYDNLALTNSSPLTKQAAQKLIADLERGGFQPNPARSVMVGVIGLWRKGEPAHEPGDRALLTQDGSPAASAHARLGANSLTLDFSNSLPEDSKDLEKSNLGTLTVAAVGPSGAGSKLGEIPYAQYSKQAYETGSGIISLPLTTDQVKAVADMDLQVIGGNGTVLLAEVALRAIPLIPNLYLDQGETGTAAFQVYRRGVPAKGPLPVTVYKMSADGGSIENTTNLQTNANGLLSFSVTGTVGGIFAYVPAPVPGATPPNTGINPQTNNYMYIRTLNADADVAALPPTWENVYGRVLANWNAMAPCMDNWLMLNDPVRVKAQAATLKRLTDPANFESFLFMPVTRDMTAGGRALLYKFLDAPGDGTTAGVAVTGKRELSFAEKSRAMRRQREE